MNETKNIPGNEKAKKLLLLLISLAGIVAVILVGPIPQDKSYHLFADDRWLYSVPNFWNVISNLPFLLIGLTGMFFSIRKWRSISRPELALNNFMFFLGIFFTGIGSAYYHFNPNNSTLLWDRLSMTISFMSFFSIVIGTFICSGTGKRILVPLVLTGILSVMYWQMTEARGCGDIRFYALVQFLPVILIPLMLLMFKQNTSLKIYFWMILLLYVVAKLFESADHFVFNSFHVLSGHTIKHIVAAAGPLFFLGTIAKSH